jgi:general L-amino acid transport system substrate-binding protein
MSRLRRASVVLTAAVFGWLLMITAAAHAGPTLDAVKRNGVVTCGVSTGAIGFSLPDKEGRFSGLDADFCRQVAAAIFGDAGKVKFVPLSAQQRFTALQSGEIDVLARRATWTLQRDTQLGLTFVPANFYDGQGFMVARKLNVKSAKELNGATVCVGAGTTSELNLADYFRANKMQFKPVVIESLDETETAFFSGRCDAYSNDASGLASTRAGRAANPGDYVILPEIISKEPLAPAVRHGDAEWFDIVKWTQFAAIEVEEERISSKNVDEMLTSNDPNVKRLLGITPGMGKALGLDEKWAYHLIKQVGNYGEVFDRNVGKDSPLKLERGLNDLWTRGGLMYAMPVR